MLVLPKIKNSRPVHRIAFGAYFLSQMIISHQIGRCGYPHFSFLICACVVCIFFFLATFEKFFVISLVLVHYFKVSAVIFYCFSSPGSVLDCHC